MADRETQFIADGQALGLEKAALQAYVSARKSEAEVLLKRERDAEREKRAHEREMLQLRSELESARMQPNPGAGGSGASVNTGNKSLIKLSNYVDGDDVAVYLRMFEKVCEANQWTDQVSMSALMNGFSGSKISLFLNSVPSTMSLAEVKTQIIKSYGFTMYDYQKMFHETKQGQNFKK